MMLYEFEKPFVVDSNKFERSFVIRATPIQEAVKTTVAWYKGHPQARPELKAEMGWTQSADSLRCESCIQFPRGS